MTDILDALFRTVSDAPDPPKLNTIPQSVVSEPEISALVSTLLPSRTKVSKIGSSAVLVARHEASDSLNLNANPMTFVEIEDMFGRVPENLA